MHHLLLYWRMNLKQAFNARIHPNICEVQRRLWTHLRLWSHNGLRSLLLSTLLYSSVLYCFRLLGLFFISLASVSLFDVFLYWFRCIFGIVALIIVRCWLRLWVTVTVTVTVTLLISVGHCQCNLMLFIHYLHPHYQIPATQF